MKAHEETWSGLVTAGIVETSDGTSMVADVFGASDDSTTDSDSVMARTLLIAAAPEMARALLADMSTDAMGDEWHTESCWRTLGATCLPACETKRAALKKAGVLK